MSQQEKYLRSWLNYNCSQGNNWVVMYKFDEIFNHKSRKIIICSKNGKTSEYVGDLGAIHPSHIYFTYMSNELLISLIETTDGRLFLVHNKVNISEEPETVSSDEAPKTVDLSEAPQSLIKKVDMITPLPMIESVESIIYIVEGGVYQIMTLLTGKERELIGIRKNTWKVEKLKKIQRDELSRISFMNFMSISEPGEYLNLLNKYVTQSGDTLNLTHNHSITPDMLNRVTLSPNIKQLIVYQNYQINDFSWLSKFPNIKLINLFYDHQMEQRHFEQIAKMLPNMEVLNIHFCTRINLRILIPILGLKNLQKLAIEDPQFWIQKGVHELFILDEEWKTISCPSIQKIAINSTNLTLDVVDYLLKSCINITQFIVDDDVLKRISDNIETGFDENTTTFNSWQNPKNGFVAKHKISFKNLWKNGVDNQAFSESMLRKIKETREHRGEKEQTSL